MNAKRVWQLVFAANSALILWFWAQGNISSFTSGSSGVLLALGRLAGLAAAFTVLLQFVFMGRTVWLERTFGLDNLSRMHHTNGLYSFWFILAHPILITLAYMQLSGLHLWEQIKSIFFDFPYGGWAISAAILFLSVVILSITIVRRKLPYEAWYFVHLLVYVAVYLSFWHQIELGHDFLSRELFYWYWIGLYTVVCTAHIVFRVGWPIYISGKHRFKVARVVRENHNVVSVYITGRGLDTFRFEPGQFMIFRFLTRGRWWQAHPFSLSFAPNGKELRITVKQVGDFTKNIHTLSPGTGILVQGPYGIFTEHKSTSPKVLLIAGGIGITPLRALWERVVGKKDSVILLYGAQTEQDIVLKGELESIAKQREAKIIPVISDDAAYHGEKGYIDKEKIQRLVPDVRERDVYVCGPVPMVNAVIAVLQQLGVPSVRIHYEKFSLG